MTTRRTTRTVGGLVAVAAALVLSSCVRVPDTGPVVNAREKVEAAPVVAPYNNPRPPQPGASPQDVVRGFLEAMTATPLQTTVARLFLTSAGRAAWDPQNGVVSYSSLTPLRGTRSVVVRLHGADRVGADGQWRGQLPRAQAKLTFPMQREDGQWRIASVPDALIVPRTFYQASFRDALVYFFDPSGRRLVPQIVHVPQGPQLATSLVSGLLEGPSRSLTAVARTFLPPGLTSSPVVTTGGVADVALRGTEPVPLSRKTTRLLLAELAWTLHQDPSIRTFQVSIAGQQIRDASGSSVFRVEGPDVSKYDPAVPQASSQIYALRHGLLVSGQAERPTRNRGPFGNTPFGIETFAVSLHDNQVAATTASALLVGKVRGKRPPARVLTGTGLLRPAWDFAGRLWEVDNRPGGAVVFCVVGGDPQRVRVPGISGRNVYRFLVSRDGSRLVAVVRGPTADRIKVSRLQYDTDGRPVGATAARPIPWLLGGSSRVRDIGWMSPTSIAVLDQISRVQAEVRLFNVDGSTSPSEAPPLPVLGRVLGLATSPVGAGETPFAIQPHGLFDFARVDTPITPTPYRDLHDIAYAG